MRFLFTLLFLVISLGVAACPFCRTSTAARIREALFGPDFFLNLFACLLPFAAFFMITILIYHGGKQKQSAANPLP